MKLFIVGLVLLLGNCCLVQSSQISGEDPELDPAEAEEAGCPKIQNLKPIYNFKEMFRSEWNLPFFSDHWLRFLAKSMHGKNMKKSSQSRSCVKLTIKPMPEGRSYNNASILVHSKCPRTGAEFNLGCEPSEAMNSKWYCTDLVEKPAGSKTKGDSHVFILGSESEDYALVVRCFPKNGMNWAIFSKAKVMDQKVVKELLQRVEGMGFDPMNTIEVPYEKCRY